MVDFSNIFKNDISVYTLIESLSEGVVIINKLGKILLVNKKTLKLFGYTKEELIGKQIDVLIPERFRNLHEKHVQHYFTNPKIRPMGHVNSILFGKRKDESEFSVEIGLSYIHTSQEILGMAAITDISARIKAENDLKKRNLELDAYAHTIAHELNSQLNSILGFSQILLNYDDLEKNKRDSYLDIIVKSGFKMNNIIRELLLFASTEKDDVVKAPLSMKAIVLEALNRISPTEKSFANIQIPTSFEDAIGYGPWVEEIWYNYIRNAIKYGGSPPLIEIGSSKSENGYSKFWVKDNGKGLTEQQRNLIFIDVQKIGLEFIKGHGFGLSIVKQIVLKLDGRVQVEASPSGGSIFSFYLPTSNTKL